MAVLSGHAQIKRYLPTMATCAQALIKAGEAGAAETGRGVFPALPCQARRVSHSRRGASFRRGKSPARRACLHEGFPAFLRHEKARQAAETSG